MRGGIWGLAATGCGYTDLPSFAKQGMKPAGVLLCSVSLQSKEVLLEAASLTYLTYLTHLTYLTYLTYLTHLTYLTYLNYLTYLTYLTYLNYQIYLTYLTYLQLGANGIGVRSTFPPNLEIDTGVGRADRTCTTHKHNHLSSSGTRNVACVVLLCGRFRAK